MSSYVMRVYSHSYFSNVPPKSGPLFNILVCREISVRPFSSVSVYYYRKGGVCLTFSHAKICILSQNTSRNYANFYTEICYRSVCDKPNFPQTLQRMINLIMKMNTRIGILFLNSVLRQLTAWHWKSGE